MKLTTHASSSKGNMFTLETEEHTILIDAGIKKDLSADILCVTHAHGDHVKYISHYIDNVDTIVTSEEVLNDIARVVDQYTYQKILSKFDHLPELNNIKIIEMVHDVPCVGFLIEDSKNTYLHITDTVHVKYEPIFDKVTLASVEANHDLELLETSKISDYLKNRITTVGHLNNVQALGVCKWLPNAKINLIHLSEDRNAHERIKALFSDIDYVIAGNIESE